ncbi:MAG: cytochrome c3 family protein [Gammaproteobacteria bacterium]|nr:cytochrome c3 family protein [Gammaproteobacteria bacterium]
MNRSSFPHLPLILLTAWLMICTTASADHSCTDCHTSNTPNNTDLIKPLSALCADCHAERIAAGEHVVDVPVFAANTRLPLHNGTISCATCHDPHQPFAALRMVDPELCRQCHTR